MAHKAKKASLLSLAILYLLARTLTVIGLSFFPTDDVLIWFLTDKVIGVGAFVFTLVALNLSIRATGAQVLTNGMAGVFGILLTVLYLASTTIGSFIGFRLVGANDPLVAVLATAILGFGIFLAGLWVFGRGIYEA